MGKHRDEGQQDGTEDQVTHGEQVIQYGLNEEGEKKFKLEMDQVMTGSTNEFTLRTTEPLDHGKQRRLGLPGGGCQDSSVRAARLHSWDFPWTHLATGQQLRLLTAGKQGLSGMLFGQV